MRKTLNTIISSFIIVFFPCCIASAVEIVSNGKVISAVVIDSSATEEEEYAAEELIFYVQRYTNARLEVASDAELSDISTLIILGTPDTNRRIRVLQNNGDIALKAELGSEGYLIKTIDAGDKNLVVVAANEPRGVLYGVYELVEEFIYFLTGLTPNDIDFNVSPNPYLVIPELNLESSPFYLIRATLETENPDWLARHRINMSAAEGVWNGDGADDGLGTAFKYVDSSEFWDMYDEPHNKRLQRIKDLHGRFDELSKRGIDSYLFMYVMGEPTEALIKHHPELLGPPMDYGGSRNGKFYRPLCWSNPQVHDLIKRLIKAIVHTYPKLNGLHLRAWGSETRACMCPECGDAEHRQELLWEIFYMIINAAREVRSDFKFYISGYNRYWLRDEDGSHLPKLPAPVIISQKWGYDGAPISDPSILIEEINAVGENGHQFLILSHDVEEVVPLWMVEGNLFVEGVRKYAFDENVKGLGGFTLQGQGIFGYLDRTLSAKIPWNPKLDHEKLMKNYLANIYDGAAEHIWAAFQANTLALSSYFSDYASSLSITGKYGRGSEFFATHFWNIIGEKAVADTLAIPERWIADTAVFRFSEILPQQQRAANEIQHAFEIHHADSWNDRMNLQDAVTLMQLWVAFFESRLRLAEAVQLGYRGSSVDAIQNKIDSAKEYSVELASHTKRIRNFVPISDYPHDLGEMLVKSVQDEVEFLNNFDASTLIRTSINSTDDPNSDKLDISKLLNCPNPFSDKTFFTYLLTKDADEVTISIYTPTGRLLAKLQDASNYSGYNEELWDGRDTDGKPLANGTYLYKIKARCGDEKIEKVGKLVVLR